MAIFSYETFTILLFELTLDHYYYKTQSYKFIYNKILYCAWSPTLIIIHYIEATKEQYVQKILNEK